jgi:Dyp-type peroxidase family
MRTGTTLFSLFVNLLLARRQATPRATNLFGSVRWSYAEVVSEAGVLTWAGAIAGWLAALTIGTFVVVGARRRRSYDPWRDTMTDLGDDTDAVATAFLVVNLVVATLLGVLAWAVHDAFHEWPLTIALVLAASGSLIFGVTACKNRCRYPLCVGSAPRWLPGLHVVVAAGVAIGIVVAPFVTWFALVDRSSEVDLFRTVSLAVGATATVLFGVLLWRIRLRNKDRPRGSVDRAQVGLYERLLWMVGYGWVVMLACTLVRPGWPAVLALASWLALGLRHVLRPDWRDPSPEFSLAECQPNTLTPFKARFGMFRVCTIDDPRGFGLDLRKALEEGLVTGTADGDTQAVTVAVTARGLERLGVRYRWRARFVEDAFCDGMRERARALGDVGPSDPARWDDEWRHPDRLHVAFWIQAQDEATLVALDARVQRRFGSVRAQVPVETAVLGRPGARTEHFGFVDGASQPWVEGVRITGDRDVRGGGKLGSSVPSSENTTRTRNRWKPIALGEFVVGQVDESGDIFPVPSPPEVFLGGTFLVVRKLRQDVEGFRDYAGRGGERGSLASRLVGRTSDGTPLTSPPPHDGRATDGDARTTGVANVFTYGHDPEGLLCPLGAHIRRANPRDALGFGTTLSARRRIIRRAMPYGPSWDDGNPDADRGLLFVACNVRISEQFEFIQQQWLNDGSPFGLGSIPDPLGGGWDPESPRAIVVGGRPPLVRAPLPSFVTTTGGEYFFVPSIPGLWALANHAASTSGQCDVEASEQPGTARSDAREPVALG